MKLLHGNGRMRLSLCAIALTTIFVVSCGVTAATSSSTIPTPARATVPTASTSGGNGVATAGLKRTNQGGNVTLEVTWEKDSAASDGLRFKVVMDTHSVDLDGIDLKKLAVLRNDGGREVSPETWDAPAGGHHRSGTIVFPAASSGGGTLIGPQTEFIELVVREVAGVKERSFKWEVSS